VKASTLTESEAEARMLDFLVDLVPPRVSPMCGNSVHQDRRFLSRYLPRLEGFFLYRNLDVSTLKELARRWKPQIMSGLTKHGKHEALADIHESIEELRYYREYLLKLCLAPYRVAGTRGLHVPPERALPLRCLDAFRSRGCREPY